LISFHHDFSLHHGLVVQKLIEEGAVELVVPGVLPIGCFPVYLSIFRKQPEMYGRRSGCIRDLNTLSWVHNAALQRKIAELRLKHPGVRIMYADYYTPAIQFVLHAEKYGQCYAHFGFVFFLSLFFFSFFARFFFLFFVLGSRVAVPAARGLTAACV
jgi:hypothetical protein